MFRSRRTLRRCIELSILILFVHPPARFYFCQLIFLSISTLLAFLPIYYVFFGLNVCPLANSICLSVCLYFAFCIFFYAFWAFQTSHPVVIPVDLQYLSGIPSYLAVLSVCLYVCLSIFLLVSLSICLSLCLSAFCLPAYLSILLSAFLFV